MERPQFFLVATVALGLSVLGSAEISSARAASLIPEETSLGVDTVGYLHSASDAPKGFQNSVQPELMGRLNTHSVNSVFETSAQADLLLLFTGVSQNSASPSVYFELPEFYAGTAPSTGPVQALVGRKLESWNHLDDQWSLGIWQPRFRWDYLHPETVGLTGLFLRLERPLFRVVGEFSPIFIPERGVPVSTDGSLLNSDSRWFIPPPSSIDLFGQSTPMHYTLATPQLGALLLHPGASLMARVGRDQGAWGSIGGAFKPMNQLLLADSGILQLSGMYGDGVIYPRVVYHGLASIEGGYQSEAVNTWFSVLGEQPIQDSTPSDWTVQEVTPSLAMSSSVDFRVAGTKSHDTRLNFSVLQQWGGNAGDQGPDAKGGDTSSFEARYPYQTAVMAGVRTQALTHVLANTQVIYDIGHQGAIWSTEVRYQPRRSWMLGVGADLLTSAQSDDSTGANLIGRYTANDRVHAGVTYVF